MIKRGTDMPTIMLISKDLSEAEMVFMCIGGKDMTDLELLKRE